MDDIKVGCQSHVLQDFIGVLEKHFGKGGIDITSSPFTNCGLRHKGLPCGGYTLDQIEYVNALKPTVTEEVLTSRAKALGTTSAEANKRQLASIEKGTKEADEQMSFTESGIAVPIITYGVSICITD